MANNKEYISPGINDSSEGKIKVRVFCINNHEDRQSYEKVLNDPSITIVDEVGPAYDKQGRALVFLKWR